MARSANVRNYNQPDATLIQVADSFMKMAANDAAKLLGFGFTPADLAAIAAARQAFSEFPEDVEFASHYYINTELRDRLVPQLSLALRQICTRAQFAYGMHSSAYRSFSLGNISKYTPEHLLRATTHTCTIATAQLPALAVQGLTAAIIAATQATAAQLNECLTARFSLGVARESATVRRIELGNALYALLVILSEKGKLCYDDATAPQHRHYRISEA